MKRGDLIKQINKLGKEKGIKPEYTEGGKHTKVALGDRQTVIPRHTEINEYTARGILKYLKGDA